MQSDIEECIFFCIDIEEICTFRLCICEWSFQCFDNGWLILFLTKDVITLLNIYQSFFFLLAVYLASSSNFYMLAGLSFFFYRIFYLSSSRYFFSSGGLSVIIPDAPYLKALLKSSSQFATQKYVIMPLFLKWYARRPIKGLKHFIPLKKRCVFQLSPHYLIFHL